MYGDFQPHLRTQYTAQYNLSIQREIAKDLLWQVGYVGSQGHRLLASHDINPGNPQTCLDINTYLVPGLAAHARRQYLPVHLPPGAVLPPAERHRSSLAIPYRTAPRTP